MRFKDIIGQEVMANSLTEIIDSGRISHAQLFLGDTVSGSLALAIAYAQYLGCTNRQHFHNHEHGELRADSCGSCPSCLKYQQLSHSDLHFYFPTAAIGNNNKPQSSDFESEFRDFLNNYNQRGSLDQWYDFVGIENKQGMIRELDADNMGHILSLKSYEGNYKVVIIWMAEKLNVFAANKILKNLEEPDPRTLIILVSEQSEKLLSTIISRTQLVKVPSISNKIHIPTEVEQRFANSYVVWMRQLFKLNMLSLSSWVDEMAALKREQQKQFLSYALQAIRECFLRNNAGLPQNMDFGDEKFNASFPTMITERNIERLDKAFNDAIFSIERNAYSKITFMELSFNISKALKKR